MARKKNGSNGLEKAFNSSIRRVIKRQDLQIQISGEAVSVTNSFMIDIVRQIGEEASKLLRIHNKKTLTTREIVSAVRMLLPPGPTTNSAITEGNAAVKCFRNINQT